MGDYLDQLGAALNTLLECGRPNAEEVKLLLNAPSSEIDLAMSTCGWGESTRKALRKALKAFREASTETWVRS